MNRPDRKPRTSHPMLKRIRGPGRVRRWVLHFEELDKSLLLTPAHLRTLESRFGADRSQWNVLMQGAQCFLHVEGGEIVLELEPAAECN